MNLEQLRIKLLAVARKGVPSDHVPFAFEKRIMSHLVKPVADLWEHWSRSLWRAAAACLMVVVLLGGWSFQSPPNESSDLSQEFENTVYAVLDEQPSGEDNW